MSDFFEIDFLHMDAKKSGDAIAIRYKVDSHVRIHVVDGGYLATGESLVEHIREYFGSPTRLDAVVVTHPDSDHASGLQKVLEAFDISELWMLRPWIYAQELLPRFARFKSVDNLAARLKEIYPAIANLEQLAEKKKIPILEPFQGARIGHFSVMAPTKSTYFDLIVASDKTPEATTEESSSQPLKSFVEAIVGSVRAAWGKEVFSSEETSAENNMSIVQFANLCGKRILLTGDAGRAALNEAADYAPKIGLNLPGIDRFQIPHHGSRRNVSTELLDRWLGQRLATQQDGNSFTAIVSSAKEDKDHPRKAVVRAIMHRGGKVYTSEKATLSTAHNNPARETWSSAVPRSYPEEQEQ